MFLYISYKLLITNYLLNLFIKITNTEIINDHWLNIDSNLFLCLIESWPIIKDNSELGNCFYIIINILLICWLDDIDLFHNHKDYHTYMHNFHLNLYNNQQHLILNLNLQTFLTFVQYFLHNNHHQLINLIKKLIIF